MLKIKALWGIFLVLGLFTYADTFEDGFRDPSSQSGIGCWWWWLNGNVTKEAITKDLQAMHDKRFSRALVFDAGGAEQRGNQQVPAGPLFGSEQWRELFKHAVNEADRLGIELGLNIQSGWNLGGPFVTSELAAKSLVYSEVEVRGPQAYTKVLPEPQSHDGYYRDVVVLAYPVHDQDKKAPYEISAGSSQLKYPPDNATDKNRDSFWVSAGTEPGQGPTEQKPEWIGIKFREPVTVSGLKLLGRKGYSPCKGRLEVLSGNQFTVIHSFKMADGQEYKATFDSVTGTQFRLVISEAYDTKFPDQSRNVQIMDFQLLNKEDQNILDFQERQPIQNLNLKASYEELGMSAPDCRFLLDDISSTPGEEDTAVDRIVDISDKMDAQGKLTWDVPDGKWCVLRFGYTYNGSHVSTSSGNWQGRVIDYLSKDCIQEYLDRIVVPIFDEIRPHVGTTLKYLQTDSWECGGMNWTEKFPGEFPKRRGYDPIPWLPVIAGKIVNNRTESNRFLADFRKTISDCVAENHYQVFADFAHKHNMGIQPESGGPHAGPFDGIKNLGRNDIVMSEFWSPSGHRPQPVNRFFVKQASSTAHIYGKKLVGAESFTTIGPHWDDVLWQAPKPSFDHELASGLNITYLHTFTCSPKEMGLPGQEYFAGTHFNPQVTWWEYSHGFIDYMMRCQYLVQQGEFVADVLYYYGDHIPNVARLKEDDPAKVLPGYDYDITNEEILLQLKVENGKIIVPGGVKYHLLVLPDHKVLSLEALEKVEQLLQQGANVLGPQPEWLVSLVGGSTAQQRFSQLTDLIWGMTPASKGGKQYGKGTVFWGMTGREVLQALDIQPDFAVQDRSGVAVDYIHYTINGADVYFVCNQSDKASGVTCSFRLTGKQPELWDPLTGSIKQAAAFSQQGDRTNVPLRFTPYGSMLFVFRKEIPPTQQGTAENNSVDLRVMQEIKDPWTVRFDPQWKGPEKVEFEQLTDWTANENLGIKYYSGKAVYTNVFDLSQKQANRRYWLDLGRVEDIGVSHVTLNGQALGVVWTKPFRIEITLPLQPGRNTLEVVVVNSWRNRLIGDRDLPKNEQLTNTNIAVRRDWKLRESGLLGPVRILTETD